MKYIVMIDTVGAHRGMHYYTFPLAAELQKSGLQITVVSTAETANHALRPHALPILAGFTGIYGRTPRLIRGIRYGASLLKISRWIKKSPPQIVHFHFCQIPLLDYLFFNYLTRISINWVITIHDVVPFALGADVKAARHSTLHRIYQNASGLILNSKYAMEKLAELDPALLQKSVLIKQGAYTETVARHKVSMAEAKLALGLDIAEPIVLVFGAIKPNKRLDLVISAVSCVLERRPNMRLLIAGQPQDRDVKADIALTKSLGIANRVIWQLGRADDEEMLLFFSAADIVVFPYAWIYQSAALLMAMSLEKSVIATAVGSNKDIIEDGKTGLLVSSSDAAETAAAIEKLLADPHYAAELARAARRDVSKRFDWLSVARKTRQFYEKLVPPGS
jgi:glycosyltransferase involved in cell wall biosynthesis